MKSDIAWGYIFLVKNNRRRKARYLVGRGDDAKFCGPAPGTVAAVVKLCVVSYCVLLHTLWRFVPIHWAVGTAHDFLRHEFQVWPIPFDAQSDTTGPNGVAKLKGKAVGFRTDCNQIHSPRAKRFPLAPQEIVQIPESKKSERYSMLEVYSSSCSKKCNMFHFLICFPDLPTLSGRDESERPIQNCKVIECTGCCHDSQIL